MRRFLAGFITAVSLSLVVGCSAESKPNPPPVQAPPIPRPYTTLPGEAAPTPFAAGELREDVVFGKASGVELKLDVAIPKGDGPFPAVVCFHGGSWAAGSKSSYRQILMEFARRGIIAASADYRLAPDFQFPAQIEDCKCSVRYLRANAKVLKLDPNRIAAIGDSSGGQLALLLAFSDKNDGMEGDGGNPEQSSRVCAVVNMYGRSDFTVPGTFPEGGEIYFKNYLGTADHNDPIMKKASPVYYITKDDPPVLTLHGARDTLVPPMLSKRLHEKLKAAGIEERLEFFEHSGHNDWDPDDWSKAIFMAVEYIEKKLKAPEKK